MLNVLIGQGWIRTQTFLSKDVISVRNKKIYKYVKQPMCITSTATSAFDKAFLDLVGPL